MHRTLGIPVRTTGALLALTLLACTKPRPPVDEVVALDQGGPDSPAMADVVKKCETMRFDATRASVVQKLDAAGEVRVQIIPAEKSSKTKLSHLGSRKGRVIAKVVNEGNGTWDAMALKGGGSSCWYVWVDDEDRLRSKFVPLPPNTAEAVEAVFDIEFHNTAHLVDSSHWYPRSSAMLDTNNPFQLTSFVPQSDSAGGGNTGWTTCIVNGCCRSRQ